MTVDAINEWTRSQIWHKFTKQPKRGMFCRIMPPITLRTAAEWLALGVAAADLVDEIDGNSHPWWETGALFYEIAEDRLDREDYTERLAARQVSQSEWRIRESSRRRKRSTAAFGARIEAFAFAAMGDLVETIVAVTVLKPLPTE